jgi:glycerophosphoryl diester phosphodiesterase
MLVRVLQRDGVISRLVSITAALTLIAGCSADQSGLSSACLPSPYRSAQPLIIAHASGDFLGPANTIEMMRAAIDSGADVIDVDIRITADGVLVGAHDDQLEDRSIASSTLTELQELDLRDSWRNPRRLVFAKPVRIATVESVLTAFPQKRISLEFKVTGGEQTLCDLLRATKRTRDVYVSSAGDAAIDTFSPLCPEVTTTVTDAMVPIMQAARESDTPWCAPVPIGQPPLEFVTAASVEWSRQHGLATYTWTADDEESLRKAFEAGVDGVYTGQPDLARRILEAS